MSIEGIALGHFSVLPKEYTNPTKQSCQHHKVFHSFLFDYRKQSSDTTTSHINLLIVLLKDKKY